MGYLEQPRQPSDNPLFFVDYFIFDKSYFLLLFLN